MRLRNFSGIDHVKALVVASMLLAACATAGGNAAVVIEDVPYELTGTAAATLPPVIEPAGPFTLTLYFIAEADESLISVERSRDRQPGPQEAIDALIAGPNQAELELVPMRARFSESLDPSASAPTDGLVVVVVSDEAQLRDTSNRLPAQVLVCTLTQFPNVSAVQLRDSRGPIQLSGANAESIESEFARRENYNDCAATPVSDYAADQSPTATESDDTNVTQDDTGNGSTG